MKLKRNLAVTASICAAACHQAACTSTTKCNSSMVGQFPILLLGLHAANTSHSSSFLNLAALRCFDSSWPIHFLLAQTVREYSCLPSFCHFGLQFDRLTLCLLSSRGLQLYNTHWASTCCWAHTFDRLTSLHIVFNRCLHQARTLLSLQLWHLAKLAHLESSHLSFKLLLQLIQASLGIL